ISSGSQFKIKGKVKSLVLFISNDVATIGGFRTIRFLHFNQAIFDLPTLFRKLITTGTVPALAILAIEQQAISSGLFSFRQIIGTGIHHIHILREFLGLQVFGLNADILKKNLFAIQ